MVKLGTRYAMHDRSINLDYDASASAVDADMCSEAVSSKIDLTKQLATVLQGSVKPSKSSPPLLLFLHHCSCSLVYSDNSMLHSRFIFEWQGCAACRGSRKKL